MVGSTGTNLPYNGCRAGLRMELSGRAWTSGKRSAWRDTRRCRLLVNGTRCAERVSCIISFSVVSRTLGLRAIGMTRCPPLRPVALLQSVLASRTVTLLELVLGSSSSVFATLQPVTPEPIIAYSVLKYR